MRHTLEHARLALARHSRRTVPVEGVMKKAAVAAVLRQTSELEVLMIRRAEHERDPWSGHMAFPGGRVDLTDPGPLSAAKRETREEIALDLDAHGRLIGELSHVPAVAHGRKIPMVIVPYVFEVEEIPTLAPDPREVQEAVWVPVPFFLDHANRESMQRTFAGVPLTLPCYHFEGRLIWGLTLKMLDELLGLLKGP
ncbi:MAG: CoA pyrophosphatase [Myxococcales bacterium]|nr:CoA pyrophosphatase [Myxococcales bacterium]